MHEEGGGGETEEEYVEEEKGEKKGRDKWRGKRRQRLAVKGTREGSYTRKDEMEVRMKTNEWNRKRRKEMKG